MKNKHVEAGQKKKKKISKKKILMASIATIASAAVIVGTLLPSAQEVVSPTRIADPPALVLNIEEDAISENEESETEKKSNRFADRLRNRLLSLPQALRVIFVLPFPIAASQFVCKLCKEHWQSFGDDINLSFTRSHPQKVYIISI